MNKSSKKVFCVTFSGWLMFFLLTNFWAVNSANVNAASPQDYYILNEGFETGTLDSRISISTTGTFNSAPGIKNIFNFGSTKAFGFGRSTCGASCFDNFVTRFRITLPTPTFISNIRFKEMELFENWGSQGNVFIDGVLLPNSDFGRTPVNDRQADFTFRSRSFVVNRSATIIELRVGDITNLSEIHIDDLVLARENPIHSDFDGDGKADLVVFRPSGGNWYLLRSQSGFAAVQFGISTDRIVPADYDGDGKTDIAVFRNGAWYWLNSSNNAFVAVQFGLASDIPVPFDYTGDGRDELAVYRGGVWYLLNIANEQFQAVHFGVASDRPVPADYDGDGRTDFAVYRDGVWYWLRSSDNGFRAFHFGVASDKPVVGDYDGDGRADQAVYRNGFWYVWGSARGFYAPQFGIATDIPAAADYDGDGVTDIAVFRDGVWYWLQSSNNQFRGVQFGAPGDRPIPAAFAP